MFDIASGNTTTLLNKMIDYSAMKQKVVSNNLANVNTPGYKRLDISFDRELKDISNNRDAIKDVQFKVADDANAAKEANSRNDGNTVNVDKEVSELMQNSLSYNVYVQLMAKKFTLIKSAMSPR